LSGYWGSAAQVTQSTIVSPLQGIGSLCEQRSKDDPTNAWQGTEDGHVILLYSLSRDFRVLVIGNRLGEFFAQPIELPLGGGELAVDEPPDPTVADAVLDRLVHTAHRLSLNGESLRKPPAKRGKLDTDAAE